MSDEPVMFVRHSGRGFLGDRWAHDWLFGGDKNPLRISTHYQNKASFDSSDYSHRPRRIRRLEKAASTPTISVAGVSEKASGERYITLTIPNSREIVVVNVNNKDIVQVEELEGGRER